MTETYPEYFTDVFSLPCWNNSSIWNFEYKVNYLCLEMYPVLIWIKIEPWCPLLVVTGDWIGRSFEWERKTEVSSNTTTDNPFLCALWHWAWEVLLQIMLAEYNDG